MTQDTTRPRTATAKATSKRFGEMTSGAYQGLRELIFAGQLQADDRLVETELADRLKVSRTPIREALQKLASEGLVVSAPRRGYVVAGFTPEFIMDHYAVREVLEGLSARLAAENSTEIEKIQLRIAMEGMTSASKANNLEQLAQCNADFYNLIAKASRNVVVANLLGVLQDRFRLLRDFNFRLLSRRAEALREQRNLLSAIEARDADKAELIAKLLVRNARQARLSALGSAQKSH